MKNFPKEEVMAVRVEKKASEPSTETKGATDGGK